MNDRFKFSSITSGDFRDFFMLHFLGQDGAKVAALASIDWEAWFNTPGLPLVLSDFSNPLSKNVEVVANDWIAAFKEDLSQPKTATPSDLKDWSTSQRSIFLEKLISFSDQESIVIPSSTLQSIDSLYSFGESNNAEIKFRWQKLCLKSDVEWIVPQVKEFIISQGRMKFVRPLYRALRLSSAGAQVAIDTFEQYQDR